MSDPHPRLCIYNGGFASAHLRRILSLAGLKTRLGWPRHGRDAVAVWGMAGTSHRGEWVAQRSGAPLWRIEDAFLRSLHTGREGAPSLGLLIDHTGGIHFDPERPSALEQLLNAHPLNDPALLARANAAMMRLRSTGISKYNAHLELPWSEKDHVVIIDQTRGDAALMGATRETFLAMLDAARQAHPNAKRIIKTHPETQSGHRLGHFLPSDLHEGEVFCTLPLPPQQLFANAKAIYTFSSQMGFEAIWAGHRPHVFGGPFYAGWGLTQDHRSFVRRGRILQADQLFAAAMILAPTWYCPHRDRLVELEDTIDLLEAQRRAYREDHKGWSAYGMRLWKRAPLQRAFGHGRRVQFDRGEAPAMVWASKAALAPKGATRVEDGFLRSRGLGAELVPPASLVLDRQGIYYDPNVPSDLEALITAPLAPHARDRAQKLLESLLAGAVSKYNLAATPLPNLPFGRRILVPGQVEDDASIRLGAGEKVTSNEALLKAVRAANPKAILLWKPHPDVEAGLRPGKVDAPERFADVVLKEVSAVEAISAADEIWTMTSTLGFEALLRGKPVVTFGAPFYAGWGLTRDLGTPPARRQARPDLLQLVYATLIAYPRYFDPDTGAPTSPEVVVEKLAKGRPPKRSAANRLLAKAQGALASYAWMWRQR